MDSKKPSSATIYTNVLIQAAPAFAQKNSEPTTVLQLSHALARDVVRDLAQMGLLEDGAAVLGIAPQQTAQHAQPAAAAQFPTAQAAQTPPVAPPVQPVFTHPAMSATPQAHGVGAPQAPVAVGGGQMQPVAQQVIGGQVIVPAPGHAFQPPAQAGVMNTVQQTSTPQGHSAFGTGGIIAPAIQKPMGGEQIVAPSNEKVISQVGGAQSTFVPEQIVR